MPSSITGCVLLIALLIRLQSCFAAYLPQPNASSQPLSVPSNSNNTLTIPDERFSMTPSYWGPKLRSTGCLFAANDAMANLALSNFYEEIVETIFEFDDQPGVVIAVLPADWLKGGKIERRFVVWGLYLAVFDMMKRSVYTCNTFHLFWEGKKVGTVGFARGIIRQSTITAADSAAKSQGLLSLSDITTTTTTALPPFAGGASVSRTSLINDEVLSVNIDLTGKTMPINSVFIVGLGAMSDLAAIDNKAGRFSTYHYRQAPVQAFMSFASFGHQPDSPPPFMTYRHVIETVAHLPVVMFDRRMFGEADMILKLNNVDVGMGLLRALRPPGGGVATS